MYLTRRQKEIFDFIRRHIDRKGYAPTIEEIGDHFQLRSLATVHKHLTNLQVKGLLRRHANRSRALELVPAGVTPHGVELPLLGTVAAGAPIEAVATPETIIVPDTMTGAKETYVLKVKGDSMIDEQIRDGDYVVVENRQTAKDGETVVALLEENNVTLKKLFRESGDRIRLQPANSLMTPLVVDAQRVRVQGVVIGLMRKY
ncbi:MAG: transcriptional repressor LexA [Vicinamibacteria bacterium]|nr:transcriptional repressor LexA [Vicinamibacteria bacterium]